MMQQIWPDEIAKIINDAMEYEFVKAPIGFGNTAKGSSYFSFDCSSADGASAFERLLQALGIEKASIRIGRPHHFSYETHAVSIHISKEKAREFVDLIHRTGRRNDSCWIKC